ncbi:MAG: formylglycine-generating enzyme family protein [Aureispira sp.]|nr:formylglycine-generating enzyme family protein [Aureispira sp.]
MRKFFYTTILMLLNLSLWANNIQISSVALTNDSTITFSISWENSWRVSVAPNNHDAAWIFIKKRDCASGQWSHVDLSTTGANHTAGAPLETYLDGKDGGGVAKGLFLRRSADGVGNITSVSVSIRMVGLAPGEYDFRVFGVEMVNIPQGAYNLGDGNISTGSFKNGSTSNVLPITSENAITVGTASGNLYTASSTYRPVSLPANYPKGFAEVYCMKYEISQGQYVDFTNSLNSDQGAARHFSSAANRHNVTGIWPVAVANAPHRAKNFLAWTDLVAYLDWAALRPMTELEYEKITRGAAPVVAGGYAWGTSNITDGNTIVSDGTATEGVSTGITPGSGLANFNNSTILGPLRCGFAAKAGTTRYEAGATYYGVMEMSGNVWEQTITTRNATGTAFAGNLGDGELSLTPTPGFANVASWPSQQASVTSTSSAVGRAFRGGGWGDVSSRLRTSDRASINGLDGRRINSYGGRGVR